MLARLCGDIEYLSESEGAAGLWIFSDEGNYLLSFPSAEAERTARQEAIGERCVQYAGSLPDRKVSYRLSIEGVENLAH